MEDVAGGEDDELREAARAFIVSCWRFLFFFKVIVGV